jgi:hypothetical protein
VKKITQKGFVCRLLCLIMMALLGSARAATSRDGSSRGSGDRDSLKAVCATAVVVGLEWSPVRFATSYGIARNGTQIATTALTAYSDQTVTATTTYTYTLSAFGWGGNNLSTQSISVSTAEATLNGDAAYCPSSVITSMTWNWSTGFNQQNGSDLWSITWGGDGDIYTFFGDGGGFFGSNSLGRASFGVAEIKGSAPPPNTIPVIDSSDALNIYGGYNTSHPSTINGKVNDIIAVGRDFYALGGIYQPGIDPGGPSGAPNHFEIVYSKGNAYSWQSNYSSWIFCSDQTSPSGFCPIAFVNSGRGNESPFDRYVYLLGSTEENFIGNGGSCACTYLARVPHDQLLTKASYQVYAGEDQWGNPIWNSDWTAMQPIFIDNGPRPMPIGKMVYNSALGRFIAMGQGGSVNQAAFYDAPNPWGPWTTIAYYPSNLDHSGGWGNLGDSTFKGGHGDALGINFINKWTSFDGRTMWATFSSDKTAGAYADLPSLAGLDMDSFSLVSVTLTLAPPRSQGSPKSGQ